jgi:predicted outer membrane repeat protein
VDSAAVGDTVLVACDTYYEHDIVMKSGVCLTSETGEAGCVTIDAQQQGRVIYCLNVGGAASIVGFTLTGGLATGAAVWDSCGGGIYCEDSSPTLANCTFLDNGSTLAGGGLFCGMNMSTALTNSTLWRDRDSPPPIRSGPTVTDCMFSGNTTQTGGGAFSYLCSPTLTRCTFSVNAAERGGGLCCMGDATSLSGCTFLGNWAEHGGGGIYITVGSSATFTDCAFSHNTSAEDGGAMQCEELSSPAFTGVAFTRNTAVGYGGAVFCNGASPTFDHVELNGNTAGGFGGGMRFSGSSSPVLNNATLSGNTAGDGSGLYCGDGSSVTVTNCIIAFGDGASAVGSDGTGGATLSCSDVYGNEGGDWVDCIEGQGTVNGNFSADPLFCWDEIVFTLNANSPCLPGNHPDGSSCGLIGAGGIGCPATGVAENAHETSWSAIKAMYR